MASLGEAAWSRASPLVVPSLLPYAWSGGDLEYVTIKYDDCYCRARREAPVSLDSAGEITVSHHSLHSRC